MNGGGWCWWVVGDLNINGDNGVVVVLDVVEIVENIVVDIVCVVGNIDLWLGVDLYVWSVGICIVWVIVLVNNKILVWCGDEIILMLKCFVLNMGVMVVKILIL